MQLLMRDLKMCLTAPDPVRTLEAQIIYGET